MQLENIKCRNCGAELDMEAAVNGVVQCEYCRSKFTLPKEDITPAALKFLHDGESSLYICRFDDAYSFYKKAAELSPNEPEAYWGMAISQFKVQYVKDEVNDRLQPICHHISTDRISDNANYQKAISLATAEQRKEYERQANEIDYIREEFYKLKQTGKDYDCFICVKVTDDATKQRTADYKHADDIYFDLKGKGYNPFFSERELGEVTGADYEARILYALYTSECMIVVCGKEEYLHTKWVKNEYTRFLRLVGDEQKESDSITIAFYGRPVEYLPGKNGKIQGIDLRSLNASEKITKFVHDHTPEARAKRAQAEQAKKESEAAILKEIEKQREAQRELEERLKNIKDAPAHAETKTSATTRSLLVRANQFLTGGEFDSATDYFNKVLDIDPESAEAWIGLMLSTSRNKSYKDLLRGKNSGQIQETLNDKHYKTAKQYSKSGSVKIVKEFEDYANEQYKNALKAEEEQREQQKLKVSDSAWKEFLKTASLTNDAQSSMRYLNADRVKKMNDSTVLSKAYSYGNEQQRARYDEYLAQVATRVEKLKEDELKKIEDLKIERDKTEAEYKAEAKINGHIKKQEEPSIKTKYWITSGVFMVAFFILGLADCVRACNTETAMFGIDFIRPVEGHTFALLLSLITAGVFGFLCGAIIGLVPLLLIMLPSRARVRKNNEKYEQLQAKRNRYSSSQGKVTASQNAINAYEKFLKDRKDFKYDEVDFAEQLPVEQEVKPAPAQNEETSKGGRYNVYVVDVGSNKIDVIKVVRQYTGWGLAESKEAVEIGKVILNNVTYNKAIKAKADLETVGAQVGMRKL